MSFWSKTQFLCNKIDVFLNQKLKKLKNSIFLIVLAQLLADRQLPSRLTWPLATKSIKKIEFLSFLSFWTKKTSILLHKNWVFDQKLNFYAIKPNGFEQKRQFSLRKHMVFCKKLYFYAIKLMFLVKNISFP